jgi:nicotinate-nucleotide pyrophosphorylase (carboxylating)
VPEQQIEKSIQAGLAEDIGAGDVTTQAIVAETAEGHGRLVAKANGILAGLEVVRLVFRR